MRGDCDCYDSSWVIWGRERDGAAMMKPPHNENPNDETSMMESKWSKKQQTDTSMASGYSRLELANLATFCKLIDCTVVRAAISPLETFDCNSGHELLVNGSVSIVLIR